MKPRTSRIGAPHAASGLRVAAPALLFLLGALLAALWLLATPAQAQALPEEPFQKPAQGHALERVEEITAPVTGALGIIHQRVERGAAEVAATAVALPEPAITEVHDEVRGVVTELDEVREDVTAHEPAPTSLASPVPSTGPTAEPVASDERSTPDGARPKEVDDSAPLPAVPLPRPQRVARTDVVEPVENVATEPATESPRIQATTSSATPTTSVPATAVAVAGYLSSAVLPGPDATATLVRARHPHATPADPADDPTVSPD